MVRVVANLRSMIAGVAVAALAMAACSGGEDTSPPEFPLGVDRPVGQAFDPDRKAPAAPIGSAVTGGTVTVLGAFGFDSLDPTEAYNFYELSILRGLVTRSLTQYVYDPEQQAMVLVPDLATDLGTPNEDFTQWSYTIRAGVRFEDGTEVTAEDVAYGIKRSFDRDTFRSGPTYSNEFFLDDDKYQGVYTSGTQYAGVVVVGDTLTIKMERPFPDMPHWAAWPAMGPIPERGSEPDRYAVHPLATGPYKVSDFTPGKSLTLVRNQEWDPDTDPGRHAYPDRYEFDFTATQQQIDATILGDSDQGQTTVALSTVEDSRKAQQLDRLTLGSGPCTKFWSPDYHKITDIRVRQAIGYALPYEDLAPTIGISAVAVTELAGSSILPPGFPGRQEYNVLETAPGRSDPDKAKALLLEAGYAPGEYEITFAYNEDNPVPVQLIVKGLEAAGFRATVLSVPTINDMGRLEGDPHAPVNLRTLGGWCSDWPTGGSWFPALFASDGGGNRAFLSEPAVDAEIERISRLPFQEQPAAWGELDKSIMTDYYPAIITAYEAIQIPHGSRIGSLNVDNVVGTVDWKDIHILP